ncbi:ATP-binding protein [Patescibacteria group bacterium]|nr:ATP-binding protein [Patescibacteria group bacterium]
MTTIFFIQTRNVFREQKSYERGLKMVPLFIHLPPPSEDIEGNGRDTRDVVEETISKAQTIYNIISSTVKTGFKSKIYGQRHFAFEIIGSQGFVYFYAAVPVAMVEVVKQAVVSAYPSARLDEVGEHNIFNKVGKLPGTMGGELQLKQSFAYPIATYQDSKRDGMQALLNALSTLTKEDGAAIQILMRPANEHWRAHSHGVAENKRNGGNKSKGQIAGSWIKSFAMAFAKPPEDKKDEKKKELTNLEQATLDAIDAKTREVGYEVLIRLVVSSNLSQRSQAILGNIVASFSVYDAPGKNGFKYVPAKDIDKLTTDFVLRIFPQERRHTILNATELATIFHFPDQRNIPTSQLSRQNSKQVDGPRDVPEDGLLLGYNLFRGAKKPIRLSLADRQRHVYVVGQTGTGKSTFLEDLAFQDMKRGNGFAFVDPHGDTAERLLAMVPRERVEDVIYFCPGDMDYPMGLNLFEFQTPDQKDFLIQEALNMLYKLYDPNHQGIMGPRYENLFRNAALTIMADPQGGTFVDIPKLFRDPLYVKQKLQYVTDPTVIEFWEKEVPQSQRSNDFGEVVSWFVSKFGAFLSNEMMRNIIGQTKSAFDLRQVMDERKILLVNLSKGRTGELNSRLLGMIFVMKFQAAAMSRANIPENDRIDFCLYVDEFQNFSTDSFATIMSEARKYHLNLIVANQFTTQLTEEVRDSVFGNMGTIVSFRVGQNDVESLARYFQPVFDAEDLLRVPNFNTIVRTLINGIPTQPFSMATLPPLGTPNPKLAEALKQLSAAKYGRPRGVVEKEIFARMETKAIRPPAVPSAQPWLNYPAPLTARPTVTPPPTPAPNPSSSSFLDEWLMKKRQLPNASPGVSPPPAASFSSQPFSNTPMTSPASYPLPQNPAVTPKANVQSDAASENISSEMLDQKEAQRIARELEVNLHPKDAAKIPAKPQPAVEESPALKELKHDDTIYIDKEGNFQTLKPAES